MNGGEGMSKHDHYEIKIKFDGVPIVDEKNVDIKRMKGIFKDLKVKML